MQVRAVSKYVRISPYKARLVVDQIRLMPVERAKDILSYSTKKGARLVLKTLESAIANAETNNSADIDDLIVRYAYVDEAPTMKRWRARARGRVNRIFKRSSHITIVVSDEV